MRFEFEHILVKDEVIDCRVTQCVDLHWHRKGDQDGLSTFGSKSDVCYIFVGIARVAGTPLTLL